MDSRKIFNKRDLKEKKKEDQKKSKHINNNKDDHLIESK
jgi:hypothetical protein